LKGTKDFGRGLERRECPSEGMAMIIIPLAIRGLS